eukprot:5608387-Amphidinium_carterae.1
MVRKVCIVTILNSFVELAAAHASEFGPCADSNVHGALAASLAASFHFCQMQLCALVMAVK